MGCLSAFSDFEVVPEELFVAGVRAVCDDFLCALHGVFASEVGDALVGHEDVDGVFGVVGVCYHGDDVADESAFGYAGA